MKFKITDEEKRIIELFEQSKIPTAYTADNADINFVERVHSDICSFLLNATAITCETYCEIDNNYKEFTSKITFENFDENALFHYKLLLEVMEIFKKYYFSCPDYHVYSVGVKKPFFRLLKLGIRLNKEWLLLSLLSCLVWFAAVLVIIFCPIDTIKIVAAVFMVLAMIGLFFAWLFTPTPPPR